MVLCHCETSLNSLFMLLIFSLNRRSWPRVSITSSAKRTRSGLRLQILSSSSVRPRWESWVTLRRLQHPFHFKKMYFSHSKNVPAWVYILCWILWCTNCLFSLFFILIFLFFFINQKIRFLSNLSNTFSFYCFFHLNYLILNPLLLPSKCLSHVLIPLHSSFLTEYKYLKRPSQNQSVKSRNKYTFCLQKRKATKQIVCKEGNKRFAYWCLSRTSGFQPLRLFPFYFDAVCKWIVFEYTYAFLERKINSPNYVLKSC